MKILCFVGINAVFLRKIRKNRSNNSQGKPIWWSKVLNFRTSNHLTLPLGLNRWKATWIALAVANCSSAGSVDLFLTHIVNLNVLMEIQIFVIRLLPLIGSIAGVYFQLKDGIGIVKINQAAKRPRFTAFENRPLATSVA